tara:strand:+ start:11576 stop:12121 length:546 start_codon:yes stop_codon:yes gene_type:complete
MEKIYGIEVIQKVNCKNLDKNYKLKEHMREYSKKRKLNMVKYSEKIEIHESNIIKDLKKRSRPKLLDKRGGVKVKLLVNDEYCGICKKVRMIDYEKDELTRECRVEHYHEENGKGFLRGLVCNRCNKLMSEIDKKIEESENNTYEKYKRLMENVSEKYNIVVRNIIKFWERTMWIPMDWSV